MEGSVSRHSSSRLTRQRQVILEGLRRLTSHPTADELYTLVRLRLPRISLGTVYRNLDLLSAAGTIQRLDLPGAQRRFDGHAAPHPHIRCLNCGGVADVSLTAPLPALDHTQVETDYQVLGHRTEYLGLCPACQKNAELPEAQKVLA